MGYGGRGGRCRGAIRGAITGRAVVDGSASRAGVVTGRVSAKRRGRCRGPLVGAGPAGNGGLLGLLLVRVAAALGPRGSGEHPLASSSDRTMGAEHRSASTAIEAVILFFLAVEIVRHCRTFAASTVVIDDASTAPV